MAIDRRTHVKIGMRMGSKLDLRQHPLFVPAMAFVIAFAGTLAIALLQAAKPFYADAGGYWTLGNTFVKHGEFSLLNFRSPLRG